jgi:dihydropteroate synthase
MGLQLINRHWPNAVISVDTFRADTAKMCVEEYNAAIINDISSGDMDKQMFTTVSHLGVPYIMMHMKGSPQNMQNRPHYDNLLKEIFFHFSKRIQKLYDLGAKDLILDPGFGFGKTMEHNYELMNHLNEFHIFGLPILVGASRKSMIYNLLECSPQDSLNGTTVLNTLALTKGANILRVHDVKAATETIKIVNKMKTCSSF